MHDQTAPRVTRAALEDEIVSEFYFTAADGVLGESHMGTSPAGRAKSLEQVTFCVLILRNRTKVVGINYGAIDPAQHCAEQGRASAREAAIEQLWPLLGFRMRDALAVTADID